jgi:hypothetical protein
MSKLNQFKTQFHVCFYTWIAAAFFFTMKMIADDIYASWLGDEYTSGSPFIN